MRYPLNIKVCMCCGTHHPVRARKCQGPCGVRQRHWRALTDAEFDIEIERRRRLRETFDSLVKDSAAIKTQDAMEARGGPLPRGLYDGEDILF